MRKVILLAALLLGVAHVSAQDTAASRNAVCISLTSGDAEYVAFTDNPLITTADGQLTATSQADGKTLALCRLADVESISAVYHDFNATGISGVSAQMGRQVEAVYDLTGKRVADIQPGQVYILKFADGSTKKVSKR